MTSPLFWAYVGLLFPFLTFTVVYGLSSPWQQTPAGRALMILGATLSVTLVRALAVVLFGRDWFFSELVLAVVLVGGYASGYYLLWTLLRIKRVRREPEVHDEPLV